VNAEQLKPLQSSRRGRGGTLRGGYGGCCVGGR
jgi:hypothetical protein